LHFTAVAGEFPEKEQVLFHPAHAFFTLAAESQQQPVYFHEETGRGSEDPDDGAIAGHFQKHLKVILLLNNEPLRSKYFLYSKSDADNMC